MDEEIAVSLNLADGRVIRFGGDEADDADVPYDISWDTQIPGGFGAASITLPKPPNLSADDKRLFSDVVIYGGGGRTLYEGYVTAVPQVGAQEIQLQCSGWSTVLERIQTFREIFVDRDLGRWGEPSNARRQTLDGINREQTGSNAVEWDVTAPALTLSTPNGGIATGTEAWYDAGTGNQIATIYFTWSSFSNNNFFFAVSSASSDDGSGGAASGDLVTGSTFSGTQTFSASNVRYGFLEWFWNGGVPFGTDGENYPVAVKNLAVYGNHGLTLRGSDPKGVYASDVVGYVIQQAPLSTDTSSIEPTTFVIPHLIYPEDVSLRQVIEEVTALGGSSNVPNDWGVYDDKVFFWRSPGSYGKTWRVRRDQIATATSEGPDADLRVAGVKVNYQDAAGTTKSVGPIGSNSDYETDELVDIDPDNPAKRIPGAYAVESVGITSQEGAVNIGKLILNERNRLVWRGSVELQGEVTDQNGNPYPVALVRAGDQIVIEDDADVTPKPIQSTAYNHSSLSLSASVGARPDSLEALLGRLAAVTDLFGS